jgi:hypothetical protein
MSILKFLLGNGQTHELLSVLTRSGFSTKQARQFLPVASESVGLNSNTLFARREAILGESEVLVIGSQATGNSVVP